jgi:hypothetical protein
MNSARGSFIMDRSMTKQDGEIDWDEGRGSFRLMSFAFDPNEND